MFWDNYYRLCAREGKTPNKVAAELEISSGTVTGWKKGALPRPQVMQKLCDRFGVTKEQLIADVYDDTSEAQTAASPEVSTLAEKLQTLSTLPGGADQIAELTKSVDDMLARLTAVQDKLARMEALKKELKQMEQELAQDNSANAKK